MPVAWLIHFLRASDPEGWREEGGKEGGHTQWNKTKLAPHSQSRKSHRDPVWWQEIRLGPPRQSWLILGGLPVLLFWVRLGRSAEVVSGVATSVGKEAWLPCEEDGNFERGVQVSALGRFCSGSHGAGRKSPYS